MWSSLSDTYNSRAQDAAALIADFILLPRFAIFVALFVIIRTLFGAVNRLYFSPIAGFPGPRVAALTFWNEFYYDVWLGGRYSWKILDYHKKYGPIVRINPFEIHINDPWFYDQLYVSSSKGKTDKWEWSMRMFGQVDNSAFNTLHHDKHRLRRGPWNPYFSKQSVYQAQTSLIQPAVHRLCERFKEHQAIEKPVVMKNAYACLTTDVISEYCFPHCYNLLERPEFDGKHYDAWMAQSRISHSMKQFGWLFPLMGSLPIWITKRINPDIFTVMKEHRYLFEQAQSIANERDRVDYKASDHRPSLLRAMMDSELLPESQKHPLRIKGEARSAMAAGTLTTSHALKVGTYHILAHEDVRQDLMSELVEHIPDADAIPPLRDLEQIPYLVATMYETLRIYYGIPHRLSRIFPDRALQYGKYVIPPGTPISMSAHHIHDNETIFPDHETFNPQRWLPLQTNEQRLQRFLACFGGGSRQCVGMEFGKAEILTALATVFRRFGNVMELKDTVRERDVDMVYDIFNPATSKNGNGVVVVFRRSA